MHTGTGGYWGRSVSILVIFPYAFLILGRQRIDFCNLFLSLSKRKYTNHQKEASKHRFWRIRFFSVFFFPPFFMYPIGFYLCVSRPYQQHPVLFQPRPRQSAQHFSTFAATAFEHSCLSTYGTHQTK